MDNKKEHIRIQSVSSVIENRMPLFWGFNRNSLKSTILYKSFKKNGNEVSIKKDNYILKIKNNLLTQTHKDILEALLYLRNGKAKQSFNMYDIFKVLGKKSPNNDWLEEIIEELANVKIHITYDNNNFVQMFGIIANLDYERTHGDAHVTWDDAFLSLYNHSAILNYSKYINQISNLNHDITKQVVRWLLSYSSLSIGLENLIVNKLGFANVVQRRAIYRYIEKIKNEDLAIFGIFVSDDKKPIISISRDKEINFFNGFYLDNISEIKKKKKQKLTNSLFDLD